MLATISAVTSSLQLLGDLRTPTLVVDLGQSFDTATSSLTDRIFVHARVAELEPAPGLLARLDCTLEQCGGSGTLALGLNNDFGDAAYYWARAAGKGASMPTPRVSLEELDGFVALRRNTNDNTNDGKRSEWVNFLRVGGEVDILPDDRRRRCARRRRGVGCPAVRSADGRDPIVERRLSFS